MLDYLHVGGCAPIVRALRVDAIADSGQLSSTGSLPLGDIDCVIAPSMQSVWRRDHLSKRESRRA
jgi:hypothetical protein